MLEHALKLVGDYHGEKWATLQSRDASGINGAFLDWLGRRRTDRPFFAFLNYFDAHDAVRAPAGIRGPLRHPAEDRGRITTSSSIMTSSDKRDAARRDLLMARDCYDDCIAYLDEQLGRLLDELDRQGLLADTDVIITSDHGEAFGEHGIVGPLLQRQARRRFASRW